MRWNSTRLSSNVTLSKVKHPVTYLHFFTPHQKRNIHNILFTANFQYLLSIYSREWFLKYQDLQWIC
jgi:hypothetical protein